MCDNFMLNFVELKERLKSRKTEYSTEHII